MTYESHRYKERRGTWPRDDPSPPRYPLQDDDGARRFYVTRLQGWHHDTPTSYGDHRVGAIPNSYLVHDRDYCHIVVATFDEHTHPQASNRKEHAHKHARTLNEREETA